MSKKYIILDDNKTPKHSLDTLFTYDEVAHEQNIGMIVDEPYVVLDFDNKDYFNVMCEIVKDFGLRTRIMKTTRGGHFWFKSIVPLTNNIKINTPITLRMDVRSWGKKSYVVIKLKGKNREWLQNDEYVDELPFWLKPMKWKRDFYNLKDGDGRDAGLFSSIIPLMQQNYTKNQILLIFNIINSYVFAEPLKEREINKMFENNEIFEQKEVGFQEGKVFKHNLFADWLIENHEYRLYADTIFSYENGTYVPDNNNMINKRMIEAVPSLKKRQMLETYDNLKLKVPVGVPNNNPLIINLKNTLFDIEKNEAIPHTPDIFTINQINCEYDPKAYSLEVDKMLNNLACGNTQIREIINDLLGYILIGDCRLQKAFILYGEGANGKSAFLDMIINWLGRDNCSSLALEDLSDRFRPAQLVGKMLNVGDDSGAELLKNTAIFKKLVTGDPLTVENKHTNPFTFSNRAKLVFSANTIPPTTDKSNGFLRRVVIIPFEATFTPDNPDYDPLIAQKVSTEEAKSYLLNIAIKSAQNIIKTNTLHIPERVQQAIFSYEVGNNNVLQFCEDNLIVEGELVNDTYTNYCLYCSRNHVIPYRFVKFVEEIIKHKKDIMVDVEVTKQGIVKKWKKTSF